MFKIIHRHFWTETFLTGLRIIITANPKSSEYMNYLVHYSVQSSNFSLKKNFYIFSKKTTLKKFLIFSQIKVFVIFQEVEISSTVLKKSLILNEGTFQAQKIKKYTLKKFLIFEKTELSNPKLKESFLILLEETLKSQSLKHFLVLSSFLRINVLYFSYFF